MSSAAVGSQAENQDTRRANALKEYQRVVSQHRDIENRVRRLREEVKTLKQQVRVGRATFPVTLILFYSLIRRKMT